MAEARKPARKPAAKRRGPTKAQALKALGLTQADLDYIKDRNSPPAHAPSEPNVVAASATLKPGPDFDKLLRDPQAGLEDRQAPQPQAVPVPGPVEEPVWYMRNLRGVDVGFRLSRQEDSSKKRTQLKPRGQRGDIVRLEPGDLKDPELQTQVAYQLIEIIPEGEALAAIAKQYTNNQQQVPAHIAMLRNPLGEEYAQANPVTMASDDEAYGIKVADLDPALMQGKLSDKEIKRDGGIVQPGMIQPVQNPSPGNIISDGFMAQPQQGLGNSAGDNQRAAEVDALARSKQFEGPGAGLGEVTVKVAPVQRS